MKHFFKPLESFLYLSYRTCITVFLCCFAVSVSAQRLCAGKLPQTRPDSRYEAVAGATPVGSEVRDKVTGLIWQRCLLGMSWDGSTCSDQPLNLGWAEALKLARTINANPDSAGVVWRLPNRNELLSLVDTGCITPTINATWFPSPADYYVWSSSPFERFESSAWAVSFNNGYDGYVSKRSALSVRLVRLGQ